MVNTYNNLGSVCYAKGDFTQAIEFFNKCLSIRLEIYGDQHPDAAITYNNIGNVYRDIMEFKLARECFSNAYTIFFNVFGENHQHTKLLASKLDKLNDL
jgi:tetratricopeptide (TPR) repeat protein